MVCYNGISLFFPFTAIRCSGVNDQQRGNICRQVTSSSCDSVPCSSGVDCVTVSDDQSVCLECPEGQVGNGIDCTGECEKIGDCTNH